MDRREFLKKQTIVSIGAPMLSAVDLKDILDFQFGFWGSDDDFKLLENLPLPEINFKKLDKPGKAPLFTNAIMISGELVNKENLSLQYLQKYPVLLTLPVAGSLDSFKHLLKIARQEDHVVGVINPFIFLPAADKAREILNSTGIGSIKSVKIQASSGEVDALLEAMTNGMLGWHFHLINLVIDLLNLQPSQLRVDDKTNDGYQRLSLKIGEATMSLQQNTDVVWQIEIEGNKGIVRLQSNHSLYHKDATNTSKIFNFPKESYQIAHSLSIKDFVSAIKEGRKPKGATSTGLLHLALTKATEKSMATSEPIELVTYQDESLGIENGIWLEN